MLAVVSQSILPMVIYLVLQIPLFFIGMILNSESELGEWNGKTAVKTYLSGQMVIWAVMQILAVPMILCRFRFNVLFYIFLVVSGVLCVIGCRRFIKYKKRSMSRGSLLGMSGFSRFLLIAAIVLIAIQFFAYYLGVHIDQDDARWLAEANDALAYGDMMTRNVSTGDLVGGFETLRDVTSPWPMFFAIMAKILHINVAFAAH